MAVFGYNIFSDSEYLSQPHIEHLVREQPGYFYSFDFDSYNSGNVLGGRRKRTPKNLDEVIDKHEVTIQPVLPREESETVRVAKEEASKTGKKMLERVGKNVREKILPKVVDRVFDYVISRIFSPNARHRSSEDKMLPVPALPAPPVRSVQTEIVEDPSFEWEEMPSGPPEDVKMPLLLEYKPELKGACLCLNKSIKQVYGKSVPKKDLLRILRGGNSIFGMKKDLASLLREKARK